MTLPSRKEGWPEEEHAGARRRSEQKVIQHPEPVHHTSQICVLVRAQKHQAVQARSVVAAPGAPGVASGGLLGPTSATFGRSAIIGRTRRETLGSLSANQWRPLGFSTRTP
jgi:hypothetical protein